LPQGANVTGNDVAGLVVNGTADVNIINSSFTNNARAAGHGAAFVGGGNATVHMAGTEFADNHIDDEQSNGGVSQMVPKERQRRLHCYVPRGHVPCET
jgi:hypothetical protein